MASVDTTTDGGPHSKDQGAACVETPRDVPDEPPLEPTSHGRRLLVCLDRSALSRVSIPHAIALSQTLKSDITLVHVMQPPQSSPATNDALGWELMAEEARAYLARCQAEVSSAVERHVDTRLEQGRPADHIVSLARELSADVVVLGSRGEGGAPTQSLGSTALAVLAMARTSVFIAHPREAASTDAVPGRILVPLDGSLRSESVLPVAARIARAYGSEVLIVHVVAEPRASALLTAPDDLDLAQQLGGGLESGAHRYLERVERQLSHHVASVRALVLRRPSERQCLLEVAQRENVDLIVLSAHGSACDAGRSFGSVTECLLTQTTIPLLALQDLSEDDLQRVTDLDATSAPPSQRAAHPAEYA